MWNLKYGPKELICEAQTGSQAQRSDLWLPRGRGGGEGMDLEFKVSRRKLLYMEWINNKALLEGTEYSVSWDTP